MATCTFLGTVDDYWAVDANWDGSNKPGPGDDAVIGNGVDAVFCIGVESHDYNSVTVLPKAEWQIQSPGVYTFTYPVSIGGKMSIPSALASTCRFVFDDGIGMGEGSILIYGNVSAAFPLIDRYTHLGAFSCSGTAENPILIQSAAGSLGLYYDSVGTFDWVKLKNCAFKEPLDCKTEGFDHVFDLSGNSGVTFPRYQSARPFFQPIFFSGSPAPSGTYGYILGGTTGGTGIFTTAERYNISLDTTSLVATADLSVKRSSGASVMKPGIAGYFCGGSSGSAMTLTDKMVFSTETTAAQTTANLSTARYAQGFGNPVYGYISGGNSSTNYTITDRIVFSTETTAAQTASNLVVGRINNVGGNHSAIAGYISYGYTTWPTALLTSDKMPFATEVYSTLVSMASDHHYQQSGCNSSAAGYIQGGRLAPSGGPATVSDKIVFSTDTITSIAALPTAVGASSAFSDASNGFLAGGLTNTVGGSIATIFKTPFSTDTAAAVSGALSTNKRNMFSAQDYYVPTWFPLYGYFCGGYSTTYVTTNEILSFSTETCSSNTAANLSVARYSLTHVTDKSTYGYACGGISSSFVAVTDRLTFSSQTMAAHTAADLSVTRAYISGVCDGLTYGYVSGGYNGAGIYTTDRITFSASTTAAYTAANLTYNIAGETGLSDGRIYGYVAGGNMTNIGNRITFADSTTAACTTANLAIDKHSIGAVSDQSIYGYWCGGRTSGAAWQFTTAAERMTFSTSTNAACTGANLSQARGYIAGVSNGINYGYVNGGVTAVGVSVATSDRITFSTSTTAANTSSNFNAAKRMLAGMSDFAV